MSLSYYFGTMHLFEIVWHMIIKLRTQLSLVTILIYFFLNFNFVSAFSRSGPFFISCLFLFTYFVSRFVFDVTKIFKSKIYTTFLFLLFSLLCFFIDSNHSSVSLIEFGCPRLPNPVL